MTKNLETGQLGEDFAAQYIEGLGWEVFERNVSFSAGEIDIFILVFKIFLIFI